MNTEPDVELIDPERDRLGDLVDDAMRKAAAGTSFDTRSSLEKVLSANRDRTNLNIMLLASLVVMIGLLTIIIPLLFR